MRSGNPALSGDVFQPYLGSPATHLSLGEDVQAMTIAGTAIKTGVLLSLATLTAAFTWNQMHAGSPSTMNWTIGGLAGGFVLGLVTIFKPRWAFITAPAYALAEGLFLGGISALLNSIYEGIVGQAVALTFGTMLIMLIAYGTGLVRVTGAFRAGVTAATSAVLLIYGISLAMNFFGTSIPYIHESGTLGIAFSLAVVAIAAFNLALDFDFIERGADAQAPKYMEWYGAFGLMVTLVWLYIEILNLLSKLNSRD